MQPSFSMRRLSCRFKEFTSHHWATAEVKTVWEPRIQKICDCIAELEWRSVLEGLRQCALRIVSPSELQPLSELLDPYGLIVIPLERIAVVDGYASARRAAREGESFHYWCAIGRTGDVQTLKSAQSIGEQVTIGRLLGYPDCCTSSYRRVVWVQDGFVDTTWPMAQDTATKRIISATHVEIPGVSWCNILLRWLGIRIVFHLPCSFDCQPTIQIAMQHAEVARAAGFDREIDWLLEMLSWRVEWSALYGLAEITTPAGTTYGVTDATAERYRVTYLGTGWTKKGKDGESS